LFKYEPMAGICRELSKKMINEPIEFVKNGMVCNDITSRIYPD
jgi:hypothetical protein